MYQLEERVNDEDPVDGWCESANLVNNCLKTVSGSCLKRDSWRVEFRRCNASSSPALDDGTLLNRFRSREQRKTTRHARRPQEQEHMSRPWKILVLPAGRGVEAKLIRSERLSEVELRHISASQ